MQETSNQQHWPLSAELVAVLVAIQNGSPCVLTTHCARTLPSGALQTQHRSLQNGLRLWVEQQTGHELGYVEQLYTFADKGRAYLTGGRVISVSYLALTHDDSQAQDPDSDSIPEVGWQRWYRYFPWEDWRTGKPALLDDYIEPQLAQWIEAAPDQGVQALRHQRVSLAYGLDGYGWNEDMVLQRYELLYEARLVPEAWRDAELFDPEQAPLFDEAAWFEQHARHRLGPPMRFDHRRILATAMARLRAKIKYRPVVFELMPEEFSLLQLQQGVEALAGRVLHKQNFRRLIEQQELVEETGQRVTGNAGRPAKLYRFRGDVILERAIAGTKLPLARQPR